MTIIQSKNIMEWESISRLTRIKYQDIVIIRPVSDSECEDQQAPSEEDLSHSSPPQE